MHLLAHVVFSVVGGALIVVVFDSAVRTFMLPRGVRNPLARAVFVLFRRYFFDLFARETRTYEARDRIMAFYAPTSLIALVAVWMAFVVFGFMLLYRGALGVTEWGRAFELSGSSFYTLGAVAPGGVPSYAVVFGEAAIGLGLLALLIAYLPTIYSAFSRRELSVTQLATRAGTPPSAAELLQRYHAIGWTSQLPTLWSEWESWFAQLAETHTSLPVLVFFRSPNPDHSWVTAGGALLDAASLAQSTLAIPWSPQAGLCIRAGALALREIAGYFGVPYDPDPAPDDPISIARSEFNDVYEQLGGAGVPVRPDRERAWRDFAGWRVNYDGVLLSLASITMAPYAPWSSDRSLRYRARVVGRRSRPFRTPR